MHTLIDTTQEPTKGLLITESTLSSYCLIIDEDGTFSRTIHIEQNGTYNGTVIITAKKADITIETIIDGNNAKSNLRILVLARDMSHIAVRWIATVENPYRKVSTRVDQTNILLGKNTQVRGVPELRIATDDIEWGHSCKVHRLGGEGLFYLQSRGLDAKDAEALLLSGEIRKHLDTIDDATKKESLYEEILEKLQW